ncbi:hypothetical protein BDB01DRAFT_850636 [Pilobolus umbonatus]|nr:hypothetical protein BDB01DRAFT_850636 [Pilobolus umbonatus]
MAKKGLSVKLEIRLDNSSPKYHPGDIIQGNIFVTPSMKYELNKLGLAWTGRIQVKASETNIETRYYFRNTYKLRLLSNKSQKAVVDHTNVLVYTSDFVNTTNAVADYHLTLSKNKTSSFAFQVAVPNDPPLPSSTEGKTDNNILYVLEAYIKEEKDHFINRKTVPIYEVIESRTPFMGKPQRIDKSFTTQLVNPSRLAKSRLIVTLPCHGCPPGTNLPISIVIRNDFPFRKRDGISVALIRIDEIVANGIRYKSLPEPIVRKVEDLDILFDKEKFLCLQTLNLKLLIPKLITPTITFEKSRLLSVSYLIRVQALAQPGVYRSSEGEENQFMRVDFPFNITTVISSHRSEGSQSYSSGVQDNMSILSPSKSSTTVNSGNTVLTYPALNITAAVEANNPNPTPITSPTLVPVDTSRLSESNGSGFMGGIFRRHSAGASSVSSNRSNEEKKKSHISFNPWKSSFKNNSDTMSTRSSEKDDSSKSNIINNNNNNNSAASTTSHHDNHLISSSPSVELGSTNDEPDRGNSHSPIKSTVPTSPHNDQTGERGGIPVDDLSPQPHAEAGIWYPFNDSDDELEEPSSASVVPTLPSPPPVAETQANFNIFGDSDEEFEDEVEPDIIGADSDDKDFNPTNIDNEIKTLIEEWEGQLPREDSKPDEISELDRLNHRSSRTSFDNSSLNDSEDDHNDILIRLAKESHRLDII